MVDAVVYTLKGADRVLDGEASAAGLGLRRATILHLLLWRGAIAHWGTSIGGSGIIASVGWPWGRGAWRSVAGHCGVDRVGLSWELEAKLASWVSTYQALFILSAGRLRASAYELCVP